ncbi:hypothetical protein Hanom_Chr06g00529821 [Helianthus anomalus]
MYIAAKNTLNNKEQLYRKKKVDVRIEEKTIDNAVPSTFHPYIAGCCR